MGDGRESSWGELVWEQVVRWQTENDVLEETVCHHETVCLSSIDTCLCERIHGMVCEEGNYTSIPCCVTQ